MGPIKCYIKWDSVLGMGARLQKHKITKLQKVQLVDKSIATLCREKRLSKIVKKFRTKVGYRGCRVIHLLHSVKRSGGRGVVVVLSSVCRGRLLSTLFSAFCLGGMPRCCYPSRPGSCFGCGRMPCIQVGHVLFFPLLLLCRRGIR